MPDPPARSNPSRAPTRRAPSTPGKIPSGGPPLKKILPYAAGIAGAGLLFFLLRNPTLARIGSLLAGLAAMIALGWAATTYRTNLPPLDRLRVVVPIVAVASVMAAIVPYIYVLYPPPPRAVVSLAAIGDSRSLDIEGSSAAVWLSVEARFVPTATGSANYFLTVTRAGGHDERVVGTFRPRAGGPEPDRRVLEQRGPGRFTVHFDEASNAIAPPLRVAVHTRPFSTLTLSILYAVLAGLILAVDTMLWRRGAEPSYASALLLPLVAVVYFQRLPVSVDSLRTDLLASAVIGVLAGGLGGELLGRAARGAVGRA
jgi:hypothetical protein